jgi:hypothetical protein
MWRPSQLIVALSVAAGALFAPLPSGAETVEERYAPALRAFEASDWCQRNLAYAAKPIHWAWTELPRSPWLLQYRVTIGFPRSYAPEFLRSVLVIDKESGAVDLRLTPEIATALSRVERTGPRCSFSPTSDGLLLVCPPTEQLPRPPMVRFRWDEQQRALAVAAEEEPAPLEVKHARALRTFRGSEPYTSFILGRPVTWEAVVELPGGRWLLDLVRVESSAQALFVVDPATGRVAPEETRALFARVEKGAAECGEVALGAAMLGVERPSADGRSISLIAVGGGTGLPTCFLKIDAALRVSSKFEWGRSTLPPEAQEAANERADRDRKRRAAEREAALLREEARAVALLKRGKQEEAIAALEALADRCVPMLQFTEDAPREPCLAALNDLGYAFWLRKDLDRAAAYLFASASLVGGGYPVARPVLMLNLADWYRDSGRPDQAAAYLKALLESDAPQAQKTAAEVGLRKIEGR